MAIVHFELSGRITRSDNHQGVHGVRVEAWDAENASDRPRGIALTNRDGSYRIDLRGDGGDASCCDCPKVYIKLRDRDCRLIHDGCADRRCCEPGVPLRIDVALAPQALWWHVSRPLSWERIDELLVPARVMQKIEDALELLHAGGLPGDLASLKLVVCATPPIEGFDRLLHDAWGALQGNATRRSHPTDGRGTTRSLGARHHLRLPRVSSTLRRLTHDRFTRTKRRTEWRLPSNETSECCFSRFG